MHHISYSSQYMEDLRMFAFISRDKKNPKYYCNVFQSPTIVSSSINSNNIILLLIFVIIIVYTFLGTCR